MSRTLVELCCATAALSLRAMAGMPMAPLTGFMGGKRRWAGLLAARLRVARERPTRALLVDAGPWGDVWRTLRSRDRREAVALHLEAWGREEPDPHLLWQRLVELPPYQHPTLRAAQYLWLQARSAGCIPVWWGAERGRWESPSGSRQNHRTVDTYGASAMDPGVGACDLSSRAIGAAHQKANPPGIEAAHQRGLPGVCDARTRQKMAPGPKGARGIQYPATIARRIRRLDFLPWGQIDVHHGDVRDIEPIPGAAVYLDPPYVGCPRYAALLPREAVVDLAERWSAVGARVLISEAEPLPLDGWSVARLAKREILTGNFPLPVAEQLQLWEAA